MSGRDNRVRIRAELDNAVSKGLTGLRRDFDATAKSPGAKALLGGVGLAAGQQAWNMLGGAVSAVTDLIGDSKQAYIEDEASQAKLRTSLRANTVGYGENADAIEAVLTQREALGFSDDEQRQSLTELVGAYGDANVALDRQRIAMDLARYAGVSLAEAGDTLIKVHAGSYKALKALGIKTDDVHSETEALAAIQKVAQGQAESFTQTIEGRLVVAETKAEESTEKLGEGTAQLSADFEEFKAGAIDKFATGLDFLADSLNFSNQTIERQIELLRVARTQAPEGVQAQIDQQIATLEATQAVEAQNTALVANERAQRADAAAIGAMTSAALFSAAPGRTVNDVLRDMGLEGKTAADALDVLASTISDEVFGTAINDGHLAQLKDTHRELVKQRDAAKEGSLKWRELTGDIADNEQAQFDLQLQMAEKEGPQAVLAFLDKADTKYGTNNAKLHTMIGNLRDVWTMLNKFDDLGVIDFGRYAGKTVGGGKAAGGPVSAGTPYLVGEQGPELMVPDTDGTIVPNGALVSGGGGAPGAPVVIALQLDGDVIARVVDRRLFYGRAQSSRSRLRT